jgi:ABC-type glycerol-3-phosphate transport system permease component
MLGFLLSPHLPESELLSTQFNQFNELDWVLLGSGIITSLIPVLLLFSYVQKCSIGGSRGEVW